MKKIIIAIVCLTFFLDSQQVLGQINYSITGKVQTKSGYLPSGNVVALHPHDSTFIKGAFFQQGIFTLKDITHQKVLLKFSSLEFEPLLLQVKYEGNPVITLNEVIVKELSLDDITITARKPVYQQKANGTLEVLIANTVLSSSNSVREILSKSPDVIVDDEGISVFGKGDAILYLNGKRITEDQLALIVPANIQKVEIIRNPSAKYDAEGAAVIHIKTIKKNDDGYQVRLLQNVSHSEFGGSQMYSNINLNYNQGRLSGQGYYSVRLGEERMHLFTTRNRDDAATFLRTSVDTDWQYDFDYYAYYGLGLQYDLTKNSYFSIKYDGFSEVLGGNQYSKNNIIDNTNSSVYQNNMYFDERDKNHSFSLNYHLTLDSLGSNLFVGGQYSGFDNRADNFIDENSVEGGVNLSRSLNSLLNLKINILSAQADFQKVFANKNTLEAGLRYNYVDNGSATDFMVRQNEGDFVRDNNLSNRFSYLESIGAAYVTFQGSTRSNKLNYSVGLRSEYTQYNLEVSQATDQLIERSYLSFFPNISASLKLADERIISFAYTSRIRRPAYQRLNPVLIYQDPYTSIQGNPTLTPSQAHAFELNSQIKATTYKVGYTYTDNHFTGAAIRGDTPNSYVLTRVNLQAKSQFFASVSRTFGYKWWTSINTLNVNYTRFLKGEVDFEEIGSRPNFYFYTNNRFDLTKSIQAEVLFWYLGDNYEGLYHRRSMHNLTIAVSKSFFAKALKVRLIANDIFHGYIASGNYNVGDTDIYYNRRWTTNYFRLSLTYNFGQIKKARYNNKSVGEEQKKRVR
ncbi:hypothetical protein BKI52_42440 [marine bacterium AO1-C]|nr:hypothetical protein BKI52_42440 [marine bacterium AO1-C]